MWGLGIDCWQHSEYGTWWIVCVPYQDAAHIKQIESWCVQQFEYVDVGMRRSNQSQDFWFTEEDHALQCWLAWGSR